MREAVGKHITCSIGGAPNRWLAKIAADLDKPDGLTVLGPGDLPGPLLNIGPEELPGVGGRMRARLERAGFSTVGDLWNSDPDHTLRVEFLKSDRIDSLDLPQDDGLCRLAESIAKALNSEIRRGVRQACADFLSSTAGFYGVRKPQIRVLAARPLRVRESGWGTELFGDYDPEKVLGRIWMRTAVRKKVTSFGTFLSTLCHEFCHHLDYGRFGFQDSPHTRGFYERAADLYHHARGTPRKPLFWVPLPGDRWRIDWPQTKRRG